MPKLDRCGEARRQVYTDAIGPPCVRDRGDLAQIFGGEDPGIGVDVVEYDAVDADRGIRPRIVDQARIDCGDLRPIPQRAAGIAALDGAIEIVPMIEHAQWTRWGVADIQTSRQGARLHEPKKSKCAVQGANVVL